MRKCVVVLIGVALLVGAYVVADGQGEEKLLRHVVLFKFKEGTTPEKIKEIEEGFCALPGKISEIKDFEWGADVKAKRSHGYTHCFLVTFKTEEGLKTYGPHAAHQAFVALLKPHLDECLVIDYWAKK